MTESSGRSPQNGRATPSGLPPTSVDSDVDVIITTHNDGERLSEFLTNLPMSDIRELFIVDDGSTEIDTMGVLDRLEAEDHHVVRQDFRGASQARNLGVHISQAPFLLYLDTQTAPSGGFLAKASARLNGDSSIGAVYADGQRHGNGEQIVITEYDPSLLVTDTQFKPFALLRRTAIEKVGGWDERLESGQDRDLFLALTEAGWVFAKLASLGFTSFAEDGQPIPSSDLAITLPDMLRIADKHRALYARHLTSVIATYESALAVAADALSARSSGEFVTDAEGTAHDLMDQLAAARSDLARSEADGVHARSILADFDAARVEAQRQAEEAKLQAEEVQAKLQAEEVQAKRQAEEVQAKHVALEEQLTAVHREINAIHATKSYRFLRVPRRLYGAVRSRLR